MNVFQDAGHADIIHIQKGSKYVISWLMNLNELYKIVFKNKSSFH